MDDALPNPPRPDSASERGLIILDVLCDLVLHCRLVCEALPDEVDMNFDELIASFAAAQAEARRTYMAADLLNRGAELGEKWGHRPSKPKAVFARHNAAVGVGAVKVIPRTSHADELLDALISGDQLNKVSNISTAERPRCAAVLQDNSQQCCSAAIYIDRGKWAAKCYVHSTAVERGLYRKRNREVPSARSRQYEHIAATLREVGREIMQRWLAGPQDAGEAPARFTGAGQYGPAASRRPGPEGQEPCLGPTP